MWHALADTRGLRHPPVRPNHLAAPSRRDVPAMCLRPEGEGLWIPNRSPGTGGPRSPLSDICRFSEQGKGRRTYEGKRVTCHPRGKNYGDRPLPGGKTTGIEPHVPGFPHGVAPVAPQYPLTPSGGTLSDQSKGLATSSSCRVVAPVAPVPIAPAKSPSVPAYNVAAGHSRWSD
jgi:hypothetical protein